MNAIAVPHGIPESMRLRETDRPRVDVVATGRRPCAAASSAVRRVAA